ncbi:murein biosynthesis integral membrane protein MurJ [Changpingibacter yushuensis]|uniref:murein biosynthesis integral membrane protein MurJ n=1 Tax=Changpingibacter yushuensis TaxID=2758440 RepID=UPI00165DC546|nr:lipid II flippase MurJ [Changpingibacter yushuensis]
MTNRLGSSVAGAAGSIALLTLLSRLVGFVRTWVQNGALGDTAAGVAYSTSNTVPNVLFEVAAGGALAGAVIPLISGFLAKGLGDQVNRTASALLTWILAIGLPLAGIVALCASPLTSILLGPEADEAQIHFGATLLRMFALQIPLYGLSVVLTGVLQAHKRFLLPAVAPMLSSATVIVAFLAFGALSNGQQDDPAALSSSAILWLGWGTTAGVVAFSLPQLVPVMRLVSLKPTFRFPDGVARRALKLIGAGLGALVAQQIQIIVIMIVANTQGGADASGAYPVYTFANAVYMVPYAVLAVPVATAVFPRLSEAAALPGRPGLAKLTARSTRLVLNIGIVCVVLLAVMATPAMIVFGVLRPADGLDVALIAMAPGLVGYALIYHCSRVLYALEESKAVVIVNSVAWLSVCVALGIQVLLGVDGRNGVLVAIGSSISIGMTIGAIGEIWIIRRILGAEAVQGFGRSAGLVALASAISGSVAWLLIRAILAGLGEGLLGALVAAVAGAGIVVVTGFGAIYLFDRRSLAMTGRVSE